MQTAEYLKCLSAMSSLKITIVKQEVSCRNEYQWPISKNDGKITILELYSRQISSQRDTWVVVYNLIGFIRFPLVPRVKFMSIKHVKIYFVISK